MTQVSKRILSKQLESKVYASFWETIVKIKKPSEADIFFSDLFTRAERINFTKRLCIAVLLYKNYEWRHISDFLKVSVSTISKVSSKMKGNGFKLFFEKIEKEHEWQLFWKDLAKLYITVTHGDKLGRLGDEGIEAIYLNKKDKTLL